MKLKAITAAGILAAVLFGNACATKKYVRNRVNERATRAIGKFLRRVGPHPGPLPMGEGDKK